MSGTGQWRRVRGDIGATAAGARPSDTLLERLAERIGGRAKAEAVFGAPVQHGEVTVIAVARVRWGLGAGVARIAAPMGLHPGPVAAVVSPPTPSAIEIGSAGAVFRPIGHAYSNPGFVLAAALSAGIVIRALGRLRR
jgi:hypothetical protein